MRQNVGRRNGVARGSTVSHSLYENSKYSFSLIEMQSLNTENPFKPANLLYRIQSPPASSESTNTTSHPVRYQLRRMGANWVLGRWRSEQRAREWLRRLYAGRVLVRLDRLDVASLSWPSAC